MIEKIINKRNYLVDNNDFTNKYYEKYCNLNINCELAFLERYTGLLNDLQHDLNLSTISVIGDNYGCFIPLNCKYQNTNITVTKRNEEIDRRLFSNERPNLINYTEAYNVSDIIFISGKEEFEHFKNSVDFTNTIILSPENTELNELYSFYYKLSIIYPNEQQYVLYIPDNLNDKFFLHYFYYLKQDVFEYDNLINFCVMVKNGGELFEKMLTENLHIIDKWTILDTGSTDNTIEIIQKVLKNKKGKLYQEPFMNFRDSRNRCLDLAGTSCKYNLMLDDTYVVQGDLRKFLHLIRGDQFADSYSLIIKSDDMEYYSNRLTKSEEKLRYIHKIHEVITNKNNTNVVIPNDDAWIMDYRADYMEKRTMDRKKYDLDILYEELEEDPDDPRTYYYLAQTYNLLNNHEKAAEYFRKRAFHKNKGFLQEKIDATFELARTLNFKLDKPWSEVEPIYKQAYELDPSRPDSLYFIGIHYYLNKDYKTAYDYFLKAFELGYPVHAQFSLKPTLSFYYLPKFLAELCMMFKNPMIGLECCKRFFSFVKSGDAEILTMSSFCEIFSKWVNLPTLVREPIIPYNPIIAFMVDGGFTNWTGSDILTKGVGGSETWAIETASAMQSLYPQYKVVLFCKTDSYENFRNVDYYPLDEFYNFITTTRVKACIVSRFSHYCTLALQGFVDNLYLMLHDLGPTGNVLPLDNKLKQIICLTPWHKRYFLQTFPHFQTRTDFCNYGINHSLFKPGEKIKNSFIYSSFPNRGLLVLLNMWDRIKNIIPNATLHIYSDVHGKWANDNYPEEMNEIRNILWDKYGVEKYYNRGIVYHGWCSKEKLAQGWSQAEYWLYPCKFAETFCLTALEAATTKTLAITNDLGALVDVVGDRGVMIKGNVSTDEWQELALQKLKEIVNDNEQKNNLLEKNYSWAMEHTWENQTKELYKKLSLDTETEIIPHDNYYIKLFKNDLICNNFQRYPKVFSNEVEDALNQILNKNCIVLEIGAFVGIKTLYFSNKVKRVHAFEPFIESCEILTENMHQNNVNNVIIYNRGLSNETKDVSEMVITRGSHKGSALFEFNVSSEFGLRIHNQVKVVKVDDLICDMIDFIYIDIDKDVDKILEGAHELIRKCRPHILIKEYSNIENKFLKSLNYTRTVINYPDVLYEY
jgi:FkbM family methyltransferase